VAHVGVALEQVRRIAVADWIMPSVRRWPCCVRKTARSRGSSTSTSEQSSPPGPSAMP
jgi:hypothetical protein